MLQAGVRAGYEMPLLPVVAARVWCVVEKVWGHRGVRHHGFHLDDTNTAAVKQRAGPWGSTGFDLVGLAIKYISGLVYKLSLQASA
jgi:hypothetical protein